MKFLLHLFSFTLIVGEVKIVERKNNVNANWKGFLFKSKLVLEIKQISVERWRNENTKNIVTKNYFKTFVKWIKWHVFYDK